MVQEINQLDNTKHLYFTQNCWRTDRPVWPDTAWSNPVTVLKDFVLWQDSWGKISAQILSLCSDITVTYIQFPLDHLTLGLTKFCFGLRCPSEAHLCLHLLQWRLTFCLGSFSMWFAHRAASSRSGHTETLDRTAPTWVKCSTRLSSIPSHLLPILSKKYCSIRITFSFTGHRVGTRGFREPVPESCFSPLVLTLTLS